MRKGSAAFAHPTGVYLPGSSGNYISTPYAGFDITGDIDIRINVAMVDWTPSAEQTLVAKWRGTVGYAGYLISVLSTGEVQWVTHTAGGNQLIKWSAGFTDGTAHWIRCTRVASTGAVAIYDSTDGTTWTSRNSGTAGTGAISSTTDSFAIGAQTDGTARANATFRYVEVRNVIAGTVAGSFNPTIPSSLPPRTPSSFTSAEGAAITINGSGWTWIYT